MRLFECGLLVWILVLGVGCESTQTSARSEDLQTAYSVLRGTVKGVNEIVIDDSKGQTEGVVSGAGTGAVIGAVDDGLSGAGTGALVGAVVGGLLGNVGGKEKAYELDIETRDGAEMRILQRRKGIEGIEVGEEIEVLMDSEGSAIVKRLKDDS